MKKRSNSRQGLSVDARAWLDGKPCGFFEFKPDDELEALWLEHGDDSKMFWRRDMACPSPEVLAAGNAKAGGGVAV